MPGAHPRWDQRRTEPLAPVLREKGVWSLPSTALGARRGIGSPGRGEGPGPPQRGKGGSPGVPGRGAQPDAPTGAGAALRRVRRREGPSRPGDKPGPRRAASSGRRARAHPPRRCRPFLRRGDSGAEPEERRSAETAPGRVGRARPADPAGARLRAGRAAAPPARYPSRRLPETSSSFSASSSSSRPAAGPRITGGGSGQRRGPAPGEAAPRQDGGRRATPTP